MNMAFLGNYDSGAASGGKTGDHVAMASAPGAGELRPSVGRPSLGQSWGELPQTYQATSPNPREATRLRPSRGDNRDIVKSRCLLRRLQQPDGCWLNQARRHGRRSFAKAQLRLATMDRCCYDRGSG